MLRIELHRLTCTLLLWHYSLLQSWCDSNSRESVAVLTVGSACLQMLIEAETADHAVHSLLLQNAETVRLVGPAEHSSTAFREGGDRDEDDKADRAAAWRAVSVSEMQLGDKVYLRQQGAARHTGISIEESIVER